MTFKIKALFSARPRSTTFAIALLSTIGSTTAARAATITVGGTCTFRNAVTSIDVGSNWGTCTHTGSYGTSDMVVVPVGTFNLNSPISITKKMTIHGQDKYNAILQATNLLAGNAITISQSAVVKMDNLTINGNGASTGIYVNAENDTNLNSNDLELNMVVVSGWGDTGIRSEGGRILVQNSLIYTNSGSLGGGVANIVVQNDNGTVTLGTFVAKNSSISYNYSSGNGGGVFSTGKLDLRSTLLQGNEAANQGGAIWVASTNNGTSCNVTRDTPTSTPSEFDWNVADQGYSIIASAISCSLTGSIGSNNTSPYCTNNVSGCPNQ